MVKTLVQSMSGKEEQRKEAKQPSVRWFGRDISNLTNSVQAQIGSGSVAKHDASKRSRLPSNRKRATNSKVINLKSKPHLRSNVKVRALDKAADQRNRKNPQVVSAYHKDILNHLITQEPDIRPAKMHKPRASQHGNQFKCRARLVEWVAKVHRDFTLKDETFFISVNLLDRCWSLLNQMDPQLLAIACMRLASKYEEILVNEMDDYLKLIHYQFTRCEIIEAEYRVLEEVKFFVVQPCQCTVVERVRQLLTLEIEFYDFAIYICKLAALDNDLPFQNQYELASGCSLLVAEKLFHSKSTEEAAKSLDFDSNQTSFLQKKLCEAVKSSSLLPMNPTRRELMKKLGVGQLTSYEQMLLR